MNESIEENAPTTVKEVGIHLTYMRRDLHDLKHLIEEQTAALATKEEVGFLEKRVARLEAGITFLATAVAAALVGAILKAIGWIK